MSLSTLLDTDKSTSDTILELTDEMGMSVADLIDKYLMENKSKKLKRSHITAGVSKEPDSHLIKVTIKDFSKDEAVIVKVFYYPT